MPEKIIGLIGILIYFVGTHLSMLTFYKPYRYWWNYYSDLGYEKNSKLSCAINISSSVLAGLALVIAWIYVGQQLSDIKWIVWIGGIMSAMSIIGLAVIPYSKYHGGTSFVHAGFVLCVNIFTNICIFLINLQFNSLLIWIYSPPLLYSAAWPSPP
ncbi:hypothetical protein KKF61_06490 [Patescibacteria group bacterium]|nr:hypothetical protein [Patescibacteria group bacterium]